MNKPVLVILAGGLGSRYGGIKQMEPVDAAGQWFMDYALYDARQAGFESAVIIVAADMEDDFRQTIGRRVGGHMGIQYAVQRLESLPDGYAVPQGRVKPWGTAHAVLSAKHLINDSFAVVNADDFYGADAYRQAYGFLCQTKPGRHAVVGYRLENTLTDHGHVSRAVCEQGSRGLTAVTELTQITKAPGGGKYTNDTGEEVFLPGTTLVSLNFWGFAADILEGMERGFTAVLDAELAHNPLKCEYYLPKYANTMLKQGTGTVEVLETHETWLGVTYKEDMPVVRAAIKDMQERGAYPAQLWKQ